MTTSVLIAVTVTCIYFCYDVTCSSATQTVHWEPNRCLHTEHERLVYNRTLEQCVRECESRTSCASVNYHAVAHLCWLHSADAVPVQCDQGADMIFSDKLNWKPTLPDICLSCSPRQACRKTPFGAFHCVTTECGVPLPPLYGRVLGNKREVGSNISYACNHGYQLIPARSRTCQSNGTWSGKEPVCQLRIQPELACPDDWVLYRESCYLFVLETHRPFPGAQKFCTESHAGGHPVAIDDSDEYSFINTSLAARTHNMMTGIGRYFWTDAYRRSDNTWAYNHSGEATTWLDWATLQPNLDLSEECTVLCINGAHPDQWRLHDAPCTWSWEVMCETAASWTIVGGKTEVIP